MAGGIYFNGRFTVVPGSYSEVDASALAGISLGATGIVAMLGEAEGGAPFTAAIPEVVNPGQVSKLYREGDLREAGAMLFDPGNDDRIPGGAQECKFVKVNPSTQSTYTFNDAVASPSLVLTSLDYGLFTTLISVDIEVGTNGGKKITVSFDGNDEVFDDLGAAGMFSLAWDGTVGLNVSATMGASFLIDLDEDAIVDLRSDYIGSADITGKDAQAVAVVTAADVITVTSSDVGDTTQSLTIYGTDNAGGLPITETLALNGTTPVVGTQAWASIHGYRLSAVTVGNIDISSTTPGTVATITAGGLEAGLALLGDSVFGTDTTGYEVDNDQLTLVAGAASTDKILIVGYAGGVATLEEVTLNGTTPVLTTETDWEYINFLAAIGVAAATTVTTSGLIWNSGDVVEVVSDDAGDVQVATIYGTSTGGAPQSEAITLTGVTPAVTTATFGQVHGIVLASVAIGNITVRSPDDLVTVFSLVASDTSKGVVVWSGVENSGGIAPTFANTGTGSAIVYGTTDGDVGGGEAVVDGASSTLFKEIAVVATSHMDSGQTFDLAYVLATFLAADFTLQELYDRINGIYSGLTMALLTTEATTSELADFDAAASSVLTSSATIWYAMLQNSVDAITRGSGIVSAARAGGADAPPDITGLTVFLAGGIEGVTGFADWQAGLDKIREYRVNTIVALTSDSAVHAAVLAHCAYMAGAGKSERDAKLGAASGETFAALKARSLGLNSRHVSLFAQDIKRINQLGDVEQYPPFFTAVLAAGMQAGSQVGTALTRKFPKVVDVIGNDAEYTIMDNGEALIQAGLNMLEKEANVGWRFLRNVTTHQKDDNPAYVEAHVNEAVNYIVYTFRTQMDILIGGKGVEATVATAKGLAVGVLGAIIDPDVQAMVQWQNLTLELAGDVLTVNVEVAPVESTNFVKTTIHLVRATFSAAA